ELPIALEFEPVRLAQPDLAAGIAVDPFVDRLGDGPQPVAQNRRVAVHGAEDEAAIALDAADLHEIELRILEVAGIAVGPGHTEQLAAVGEGPAVIGAGERLGIALLGAADAGAAMGAAVEQRAELALPVARHDQRPQAQLRGDEIVRVRDLALMREID